MDFDIIIISFLAFILISAIFKGVIDLILLPFKLIIKGFFKLLFSKLGIIILIILLSFGYLNYDYNNLINKSKKKIKGITQEYVPNEMGITEYKEKFIKHQKKIKNNFDAFKEGMEVLKENKNKLNTKSKGSDINQEDMKQKIKKYLELDNNK